MLKKFSLLLLVFYFLSCHTVSSSTVDIEKLLPDGTMELWEIEKTIVEAKIKESPAEYINTLQAIEVTNKPPSKIKFKLWIGGTNYKDIYIVKRNETRYAYIYVEEDINGTIPQNIIDEASVCIDMVYPRLSNWIADPETRSADRYDKILIIIANITHAAGYFSAAWETGAYGPEYGDNGRLDCIVVSCSSYYVRCNTWGTIAHEIGHMLSYKFGNGFKEIWLEEGIAEYASYIGEGKLIDSHKNRIAFFSEDPGRYSLTWAWIPPDLKGKNALYGASFLFMYYISEKYGGSNTIKKILTRNGTTLDGVELINNVLQPYQVTFSDVFKNWIIANYLDNYDPPNPLWRYDNLDIQVNASNIFFTGQSTSQSDTVNRWAADYYRIVIADPDADNFYYKLNKDFWSVLILINSTGTPIIVEKSMLINQTNFIESKEYQMALKQAEEKGMNISKSILPETPPINANNTVTNAEKYQEIVIVISPLDKSGDYTLNIEEIPDKHKTTNSLNQGEKAIYVIPVNIFGQPNWYNLYESNGDVFVSIWWEGTRELDVKLTLASGKQGTIYYPDTGIDERIDVVGESDLWLWENQIWKLEIEERGNPSDPTIKIATNYLEGSVDDNQIFSLPTKLKINPIQMFAGPASSPTQIEFEVEIYNGNSPFHYAPYDAPTASNFEIKIGGKRATILSVVQISANKYRLIVAPPTQQQDGRYDLTVNFTFEKFGVSNTATAFIADAVEYGAGEAMNVDVALVIDSSGSMSINDPTDLRKHAAKFFVDLLEIGDRVAVIDFDEDVVVWKHLTEITSPEVKEEIKNAIDNVDSSGSTNIGGGLLKDYEELNTTQTGNRKAVILLTDGYHNTGIHPDDVVPLYVQKGWPIYTIALTGDADEDLLRQIAYRTGGKFIKAKKAEDLLEIYNDLKRIIKKQATIQKVSGKITQNESINQSILIDASIKSFEVTISWEGGDLDLYLYYPNGTQVELNASSPTGTNDPNITYISSSTYELYSVKNPIPGIWSYRIVGKQVTGEKNFTATVAATTDIILSATTDKAEYYLHEPVTLMASLTSLSGSLKAEVIANITKPDGFVETLILFDTGRGSYRALYTNTSVAGTYNVEMKANASGVVRIASLQFEVLPTPPQLNVLPRKIELSGHPGDTLSATFTIEYNASRSVLSSAFLSLLKELESSELLKEQHLIQSLQASAQSGLTGVVIIGDFVGKNGTINATNVMISHPVISLPAGKLNVTIQLNLPYNTRVGNYVSTIQVITNVGTELVDLNLTVKSLNKTVIENQIKNDLNRWLSALTQSEKAFYIEKIADRLVYWRYVGG